MALRVLGIRHGEVHNPGQVIYSGLPGFTLSELGRSQAADVARALRKVGVAAIYSSPLERAVETAGFIADATGVPVTTDERLIEWKHWEQWAGLRWDELAERSPETWTAYTTDPGSVTSGESLDALATRVASWLDDVERHHGGTGGVVVGVSHLEPLRAILLRLLGRPASELFALDVGHCGVVSLHPSADASPVDLGSIGRM